ncbi:hypothetical protein Tco_1258730 [Tanacetum coccineum]
MKTRFSSSQVLSKSDEVLPNHLLVVPIHRRNNVVDRNGCDIFSSPKLPFGVSERSEHFCVATPSHDRETGSN